MTNKTARKIRIATNPLTNHIYAGYVLKDGRTWSTTRDEVTIEALLAVVAHIQGYGRPVVLSREDGTPEFKISVEDLRKPARS